LPVALEVDYATEQMAEPVTLTTQDVGEGGLFLKTEFPLDPGTRFGCRFHLGSAPLLAEGEVAWIRNGPPESDPPPGMGVRFVAVNPTDAERLRQFVFGVEADDGDGTELPRVSFQLCGVGQPLPGEFRAMSDTGLAAVAELPFLRVGATVQVNIDEPGRTGPLAGRIAWLSLERDDDADDQQPPRIRLGIHFDDTLTDAAAAKPHGSLSRPVPLTARKVAAPVDTLAEPAAADLAAVDTAFMTPWQADIAARPRPASGTSRRRRVRNRQAGGLVAVSETFASLRERAAKNPKAALGFIAGAVVLVVTLGLAFAFSGSGGKRSKAKSAAKVAVSPAAAPADAPPPSLAPPTPAPTPAAGAAAAAPPLPVSGAAGKGVLASGPGVDADPAEVLGKGAASGNELLQDPGQAPQPRAQRVHSFTLGKKFVVKLPLQSKPGRVKHYLLANPNGAVIDVAGAAPSIKPGRYKVADSRVRMVKVLHRGKGARFIVYYGKRVKKPKISVVSGADSVSFMMTGPKGAARPRVAKRASQRLRKARGIAGRGARRGARVARRPKAQVRRRNRTSRRVPRRRPVVRKRVAPVADATD
jgi:uncharacterized protein (TIGR02266 family)